MTAVHPVHADCIECGGGFTKLSDRHMQIRCPICQKKHQLVLARIYKLRHKEKLRDNRPRKNGDARDRERYYKILDDPQQDWSGRLSEEEVRNMLIHGSFTPNTILKHGCHLYQIFGEAAPEPFQRPEEPQRMVEITEASKP